MGVDSGGKEEEEEEEEDDDGGAAYTTTTTNTNNDIIKPLSLPSNPMILRNPGWLERVVEGTFYCGCAGVASGLAFALVRGPGFSRAALRAEHGDRFCRRRRDFFRE